MHHEKELAAGAIIFRKEDKRILYLVLFKRRWKYWEIGIKGHIEQGETEIDAIKREAREETGIVNLRFIPGFREKIEYTYVLDNKRIHKIVFFKLAETTQKNIKLSSEHIAYAWLPYEEAFKILTHREMREVLRKAHNYLRKLGIIQN